MSPIRYRPALSGGSYRTITQYRTLGQYYRYKRAMKQANTALDSLRTLLTDSIQLARLDTVGMLFMDKERNMRNLLKAIQDGGTDKIYKQHIAN